MDYPEFHLNEPFQLIEKYKEYEGTKKEQEYCNRIFIKKLIVLYSSITIDISIIYYKRLLADCR